MRKELYYIFLLVTLVSLGACKDRKSLFQEMSSSSTNINFENKPVTHKGFSILYYLYYYNGAGVSTGDINNDGLVDIFFTANSKGGNKLYLNKGDFKFEDITAKAGVAGTADWCTGVTLADVNADGYLDIYVSTVSNKYDLKGHNELFINNKDLTFTEKSASYGLDASCVSTQSAFFDYDKDGDLDCYLLNQSHHPHANIVDTSNRRKYDTLSGDRLYRNDVNLTGKFVDVSAKAGIYQSNLGYGLGLAIADLNNDGWDDIYVGNDFHENDYYYVNNKNGTFTEEGARHFNHYSRFSMGNDVADYNNDGQLDIVTVDMLPDREEILKTYGSDENPDIYKVKLELRGYQKQYSKNSLQRNNGNGQTFSETSLISGVAATDWSWCPLFADFDNDGNKDLFVSSGIVKRPVDLDYVKFVTDMQMTKGIDKTDKYDKETIEAMPDGSSHPYFFKGDGKLKFSDVSSSWGTGKMKGYYCGAAYADLDNDGNVDVVINSFDAKAVVLKNNAPSKNHVSVEIKGDSLNTFAVGAKAYLFANGKMQYQQLSFTRGFQSSSDNRLHFGIDSATTVDSILFVWPDLTYTLKKNLKANTVIKAAASEAAGVFIYTDYFKQPQTLFTDVTSETGINWLHRENDFLDYNVQYLIPHAQSTRGPKLAVADVNKDGFEDFYVCAALGQRSTLMMATATGKFVQKELVIKDRITMLEEVDAVFFDANNDTWPDLYVVTGGNMYTDGNPGLKDNLYINDGKGNLEQVLTIPVIATNKSCVSTSDFDRDGDIDLFIGGLTNAKAYGVPQTSYLLVNDGKAGFTIAPQTVAALEKTGIVTASAFADINKDGWDDLLVTGEWMPLKIFINEKGKFKLTDVAASTGLWQCIKMQDVNDDGYLDILAGNWGLNNKLIAGKNGPVKLYVKDFDKNGSVEQVLCYTIDGKEYTFLAKDELERSLPVLKKAYLKYNEVAGKTVQYMFYDLFKDYEELKAEVLASSCFLNDGKGGFVRQNLQDELQLSPIMTFTNTDNSFIAAGNFYGTIPYEGRYDALWPTLFSHNKRIKSFSTGNILQEINGEVRDMKWINTSMGKLLLISRNNDNIIALKQNR